MKDQDLFIIWKSSQRLDEIKIDKDQLLKDLKVDLKKFDRKLFYRDLLESSVAILMIPIFVFAAIKAPFILTQIGASLLASWCVFVIYYLKKNKTKIESENLSNKDYLLAKKDLLLKQYRLLDSILYWYLMPFILGMLLFVIGFYDDFLSVALRCAAIIGLSTIIYFMNKKAAQVNILPKLNDVDELLKNLED